MEVKRPTSLLVAQFFLFPLIVIAFGVGIFVLFGYVAYDQKSPEAYLNEIRSGGAYSPFDTRRWQAALELSGLIGSRKEELQDSQFARDLLSAYTEARTTATDGTEQSDPRLRQFLAISLGHLGNPQAVPALIEGLTDREPEAQIWTLWALGNIGDATAADAVVESLQVEDAGVRKMAAYVLGTLQNSSAIHHLEVALNDPVTDVRWNAAMALARMSEPAGADLLIELTDRAYLAQFTEMSEEEKNDVIVNAIKCLGLLKLDLAHGKIVYLSTEDQSLSVRDAALAALAAY